jgi:hypothetical protein
MNSQCRANADRRVVTAKLARAKSGRASAVNEFVDGLRAQRLGAFIPYVDPDCGCTGARILMLFQDPGPKAAPPAGSGMLSISNDDASAQTICQLLAEVGIPWDDVMPWNAVPWYTGGANTSADKLEGLRTLGPLTALLPRLKVVVTFGGTATKSWERASEAVPALARYEHISTLHPSVRGQTRGGRQSMPIGRVQLVHDLRTAKSLLG